MKKFCSPKITQIIVILVALLSVNFTYKTAKADQVHGILSELKVTPNQWYVKFNDNYDRCGANGRFFIQNTSDIALMAKAILNRRAVKFQYHCYNGGHMVDSWSWWE